MMFSLYPTVLIWRHLRNLLSTTGNFSVSTRFIHVDGLSNYLLSFQTQPAANFLKITAASLIRNTLAITLTNLLKKDLTFTSNIFKGHLVRILLLRMHFLLLLSLVVVARDSSSRQQLVVVAVILIVLVVNSASSSCGSSNILTWTGKYKSGAITGARIVRGPGNTKTLVFVSYEAFLKKNKRSGTILRA